MKKFSKAIFYSPAQFTGLWNGTYLLTFDINNDADSKENWSQNPSHSRQTLFYSSE